LRKAKLDAYGFQIDYFSGDWINRAGQLSFILKNLLFGSSRPPKMGGCKRTCRTNYLPPAPMAAFLKKLYRWYHDQQLFEKLLPTGGETHN